MKIFTISCHSRCGSYFQPYLKRVVVLAENQTDAMIEFQKWSRLSGNEFIYTFDKWNIEVCELVGKSQIIDWDVSSDY